MTWRGGAEPGARTGSSLWRHEYDTFCDVRRDFKRPWAFASTRLRTVSTAIGHEIGAVAESPWS